MASNVYDMPSGNDLKEFFRKFKGLFIVFIILVVAATMFLGSFYTIKEQEQAVVTTFGKAKTVSSAGLHLKIPVIQSVHKVDTTIRGLSIGYDLATNQRIDTESMMITSDFNFVNVDFYVEYKVSDPVKFLYASEDPVVILKNIAQSSIRATVGSYNVDDVITTGKYEIQSSIKQAIIDKLLEQEIGLQLVNISLQDAEPPTAEVMEAFKAVETAKQGAETSENNANKYRNEQIPQAEAQVDRITQEAESTKQRRINEANAEVARFNEMYEEYIKNPLITKQRMYYETIERILPHTKLIIDNGSTGVQKLLPLEPIMEGGSR